MFVSNKIILKKSTLCNEKGIFAKENINNGEKILQIGGKITTKRNDYTVQIDNNKHLSKSGRIDDFLNHFCNPNCYISFGDLTLVALRKIRKGEELSFHYCTTEFDLGIFSFRCNCGSKNCLKEVKGFKYLSDENRLELKNILFPYLKKKLKDLLLANSSVFSESLALTLSRSANSD